MATETAPAQVGFERPPRDQPAGTRQTAAHHRETIEEERRAGARAGHVVHLAGGNREPAETESSRHDRAAGRGRAKETVAGGVARAGKENEAAGWPNESNLGCR